jgi:hypothetical protein
MALHRVADCAALSRSAARDTQIPPAGAEIIACQLPSLQRSHALARSPPKNARHERRERAAASATAEALCSTRAIHRSEKPNQQRSRNLGWRQTGESATVRRQLVRGGAEGWPSPLMCFSAPSPAARRSAECVERFAAVAFRHVAHRARRETQQHEREQRRTPLACDPAQHPPRTSS